MAGYSGGAPKVSIEVDASESEELLDRLARQMSGPQFERALYGIMSRTARHVSKVLKTDLPRQYYAKSKEIGNAVKRPRITGGGALGVGCIIPIRDSRGSIGGRYTASGQAPGWRIPAGGYRVKAKIVKEAQTVLPERMKRAGGMKPFRNSKATKLNKVAFSRVGKDRLPIQKVMGIAIPQMPMNRSRDDVQKDIADFLMERVEARLQAYVKNGR